MQKSFFVNQKIITILVLVIVFTGCYFKHSYDYLSITRQVEPDVLVVEGWLENDALDKAKEEFIQHRYKLLITTGFPNDAGYIMGSGGRLVYDLTGQLTASRDSSYQISLLISGSKAKKVHAHFVLYADTLKIGDDYSSSRSKVFTYDAKLKQIPGSITVEFDNDTYTRFRDRNLIVYSLEINKQVFHTGSCEITYSIKRGGRYHIQRQLTPDKAHDAARYLIDSGISDSLVFPVATVHKIKSKTYTTALCVKEFLQTLNPDVLPAMTVLTKGAHARRSFISYEKAFGDSAQIGVISVPDHEITRTNWWKTANGWKTVLYETGGVAYAWMAL